MVSVAMRRIALVLVMFSCAGCQTWGKFWDLGEIPSNPFYGFYGTSGSEQFNGVAPTNDKGIVAGGFTNSNIIFSGTTPTPVGSAHSGANSDGFAIKFNGVGDVEWLNYFGGSGADQISGLAAAPDGGFVLFMQASADIPTLHGKTPLFGFNASGNDFMVVKISAAGALQWYTFLGGGGSKTSVNTSVAPDGSIYLIGSGSAFTTLGGIGALNTATGTGDIILVKMSSTGSVLWWLFIGGSSGDLGTAITATSDGGVIAAGTMANTPQTNLTGGTAINTAPGGGANQDAIVARFDAAGNTVWYMYVGSSATTDTVSDLKIAQDSGVLVSGTAGAVLTNFSGAGTILSYNAGNDAYVMRLASNGNPQWVTYLGGASGDTGGPLAATSDGGAVMIGSPSTNIASIGGLAPLNPYIGSSDWMQFKVTSSGSLEWFQYLGSLGGDTATRITETSDGQIAAVGYFALNVPSLKGLTPKNAYAGVGVDAVVVKLRVTGGI